MDPKNSLINKNIFINCPYDKEYLPLLKVIIFTILRLGFNPRIAAERSDSSENRIDKIVEIINQCRYSIHDLSRSKAKKIEEIARFNMPFELGIDYGCLKFSKEHSKKSFLILEEDAYNYQKCISDLSGVDIKHHKGDISKVVKYVRDWICFEAEGVSYMPAGRYIFENEYMMNFQSWYLEEAEKNGYTENDYEDMPIIEYIKYVKKWNNDETAGNLLQQKALSREKI